MVRIASGYLELELAGHGSILAREMAPLAPLYPCRGDRLLRMCLSWLADEIAF